MAQIEKRNNAYRITVNCGTDGSGKQIRQRMTWKPDNGMTEKQIEKELQRQAVLFEEKCRSGIFMDNSITLSDFSEQWLESYAKSNLKAKTIDEYKKLLSRILTALGHIRLNKIQPQHIIKFLDNLQESGIRDDIKYSYEGDFFNFIDSMGFTKSSLADSSGVAVTTIRSLCRGNNISAATAEKISACFKCSASKLFRAIGSQKLSSNTVLHYYRLLSDILNTAVQWQLIPYNPCTRVKPPKVTKKPPRYLDEKEAAVLLERLESEPPLYRTIIKTLLFTGLRRGEVLGLEWNDIDFDNRLLYIRRNLLYTSSNGIYEDTTKTGSSERCIKVSGMAISCLQDYREYQNKQILKIGDRWHDTGKIFTRWDGEPLHPDSLTGWFNKFIKKNDDLTYISIHSLRHTNATLQIASNVNIATVAKRLGHATPVTTGNIYTHAIKSADEAAADIIENILIPQQNRLKKA